MVESDPVESPCTTELEATLAPVALERARVFAPFVLGGIVIAAFTSGYMGVPLTLPVYL